MELVSEEECALVDQYWQKFYKNEHALMEQEAFQQFLKDKYQAELRQAKMIGQY